MGCQCAIAEKVVGNRADYLIAVKDNQPTLAQGVESRFEDVDDSVRDGRLQQNTTIDQGHGRIETRRCVVAHDVGTLAEPRQDWPGLHSVVMVESIREAFGGRSQGERTVEWRYYGSSLQADAAAFNAKVRAHWGIENSGHPVLDVAFNEDACRIRRGDGAHNFTVLRRIAFNLIRQEKFDKASVRLKRLKAGWSIDYLQKLLGLRPL